LSRFQTQPSITPTIANEIEELGIGQARQISAAAEKDEWRVQVDLAETERASASNHFGFGGQLLSVQKPFNP
jgi:hypothetical protein